MYTVKFAFFNDTRSSREWSISLWTEKLVSQRRAVKMETGHSVVSNDILFRRKLVLALKRTLFCVCSLDILTFDIYAT